MISLHPERLLAMLEEIGRARALTSDETDLIEEIVTRTQATFKWNCRLDDELWLAARRFGGISAFARRHNITPHTAYLRLHRLKAQTGRGKDSRFGSRAVKAVK